MTESSDLRCKFEMHRLGPWLFTSCYIADAARDSFLSPHPLWLLPVAAAIPTPPTPPSPLNIYNNLIPRPWLITIKLIAYSTT